jgi:hypothetical protein
VIAGLYGPAFGYRTATQVIRDIEVGEHSYYARAGSHESEIRVVQRGAEKHLVSTADVLSRNNLFNLPWT